MTDSLHSRTQPLPSRKRAVLFGVVGLSVLASMVVALWPNQIRVFSDTAHYMSTAGMIRDGNGIQSELVYYNEQAISGKIPAAQTVFPPGYPALTAAFSVVTGLDVHPSGRVICLLAYMAISPLIFLLACQLGLRLKIAAGCALLWLMIVCGWVHVWCYSSDMPFIAFTLMSVLCYLKFETEKLPLIAAGIVAALAVSVRYTGVFLGVTYGVVLLLRYRSALTGSNAGRQVFGFLTSACVLIGPSVLVTLGLFVRNQSYVGTWSGGNNYSVDYSYMKVVKMFMYSIGRVIGFSIHELRAGHPGDVLFALSCIAIGVAVLYLAVRSFKHRGVGNQGWGNLDAAVLLYIPISMAMLIYLHKTRGSGISSRLILPTFPLVVVAGGLVFQKLYDSGRRCRYVAVVVTCVLLVSAGLGQAEFLASHREQEKPSIVVAEAMTIPVHTGNSLRHFLTMHCDAENSLLSSMPQMTYLFVERPSVGLPIGFYNTQGLQWTTQRVADRVERFRVRYVLAFVLPNSPKYSAEFFNELQADDVPSWLNVLHRQDGAFTLYEVVGRGE